MYTVNCVRHPTKRARIWGGHVLDAKRRKIVAGWCCKRCANAHGFRGQYRADMGLRRTLEDGDNHG